MRKMKQLEKELIDGYLAMAREDGEMAEKHLEAGMEVLDSCFCRNEKEEGIRSKVDPFGGTKTSA
jgi:hypothetical protein